MKINTIYNSSLNNIELNRNSDKKWELSDSLKVEIQALAKEDAQNNMYMGNKFMNLRKNEVSSVAPNRSAIIGKISQSGLYKNIEQMKEIQEADKRILCMLFGKPYEAEYQSSGKGSAIHVFDKNNDEILTYTQGVGWHEKESKLESRVHQTLKSVYYEAYHSARQDLKAQFNPSFNITI